jgi:hypothetical protein
MSLPPILRSELTTPAVEPRSWYLAGGASYLGLFVSGPYFDQLWTESAQRSGLPWSIGEALVASALCLLLFYIMPARLGFESRRRLGIVAASTFGTAGSEWLTGVGIGLASVVWLAVAVNYAVDSTFRGIASLGLMDRSVLGMNDFGPLAVKSLPFCATAAFWIYIAGMSSLLRLTGVVVALMRVYAPVALVLLTATAAWFSPALIHSNLRTAASSVIPMAVGFFAMPALFAVDWGASARSARDLAKVGLLGVFLASFWVSVMSLIVTAGAARTPESAIENDNASTYRSAIEHGVGGPIGGTILILFGLAAMAGACYSSFVLGDRLSKHWPKLPLSAWTWIGGGCALLLATTGLVDRLDRVYPLFGGLCAPALGAMAGDRSFRGINVIAIRPGVNPAGLIGWFVGVLAAGMLELTTWRQFASPSGFFTAGITYAFLARAGLERPAVPIGRFERSE